MKIFLVELKLIRCFSNFIPFFLHKEACSNLLLPYESNGGMFFKDILIYVDVI